MSKEDFTIVYWVNSIKYESSVVVTYHTDNVMRFKVIGGNKEIYLEKHLFKKTHQWKYIGANFTPSWHSKKNEMAITTIMNSIDFILLNKSNVKTKSSKSKYL